MVYDLKQAQPNSISNMDGYNLSTVLKRLEAATSRLEDIMIFAEKPQAIPPIPGNQSQRPSAAISPLEHVSPRTSVRDKPSVDQITVGSAGSVGSTGSTGSAAPSGASGANGAVGTALSPISSPAPVVSALAELSSVLAEFTNQSEKVDAVVFDQAKNFADAANAMTQFVEKAVSMPKPELAAFPELLTPVNLAAAKVDEQRSAVPSNSPFANCLATVASGVPALGWVAIEGKQQASGFVQEMRDSAMFYANRVLNGNKELKPWVDSFIAYLDGLKKLVAETCPEGLEWNSSPGSTGSASSTSSASPTSSTSSASGGAPPPPPPPPSVDQLTANLTSTTSTPSTTGTSTGGGMSGVFSELSKGESIASGLKPSSRATLKNEKPPVAKSSKPKLPSKPKLRNSAGSANSATSANSASSASAKLKPRVELVDTKWYIEDLNDRHDVEVTADIGQSVQIDNCTNCTVKIMGKGATFSVSRCKKIGVLVDNMVASCDIMNSSDFGVQITGNVPSLMIDQCANGSIYLSEESIGADLFTSQSTAINVNVPTGEPGAYTELSLGEQIVHNVVNGSIKSTVVQHA